MQIKNQFRSPYLIKSFERMLSGHFEIFYIKEGNYSKGKIPTVGFIYNRHRSRSHLGELNLEGELISRVVLSPLLPPYSLEDLTSSRALESLLIRQNVQYTDERELDELILKIDEYTNLLVQNARNLRIKQ